MKRLPSLTVLTILQGCAASHGDMSRHAESAHVENAQVDSERMNPVAQTAIANSVSPI
jgi:hypothetical protein